MDIIIPDTDPAEVYPQVRVRFLAEARDEKGNDVSDRAAFSWAFSDAEDSTVGNPVLHRFPELGKFLVSVSATLDSDFGCDETTVIVIPSEGGGLRQFPDPPAAGDFAFTANGHETGHEVSDDVTLLVELVEDIGPWWWGVGEFQRYENGQWITPENQGWGEAYGWFTTLDDPHNGPVPWRARVMVDEIGAEPPNGFDFYLFGTWTVVNTVVKSASPPLIIHHAEDTSHTIAWDLTHCTDFDPHFTMTVTIYDLGGATVATLVRYSVPLEEENPQIVWNTDLPEEDGIYAYRIHASHYDEPGFPFYPCVDQDKPGALATTLDKFYWFDKDPVAGTLRGVVKYTLNVDAYSGSVTIRFYGPDLEELDSALEDQDELEGTHFSEVYQIDVDYNENDELIGPIYCVIFAGEGEDYAANNRDRESKPALQKGTADLRAGLQILQPDGFADNHFSFDAEPWPGGACAIEASGTASGLADDADLQWWLSPTISDSTLTTAPAPPYGPGVTFTYTGLPASNSQFGPELLRLTHPSFPWTEDTQEVEAFFRVDAKNHGFALPGWSNATPNWYYYWREGDVVSDLAGFLYEEGPGFGSYYPDIWWYFWRANKLYVHDAAWTSNDSTQVTNRNTSQVETIGADGTGVDCCAETCAHELEHKSVFWSSVGQLDTDGDGVSDDLEDSTQVPGGYYLDKYWRTRTTWRAPTARSTSTTAMTSSSRGRLSSSPGR